MIHCCLVYLFWLQIKWQKYSFTIKSIWISLWIALPILQQNFTIMSRTQSMLGLPSVLKRYTWRKSRTITTGLLDNTSNTFYYLDTLIFNKNHSNPSTNLNSNKVTTTNKNEQEYFYSNDAQDDPIFVFLSCEKDFCFDEYNKIFGCFYELEVIKKGDGMKRIVSCVFTMEMYSGMSDLFQCPVGVYPLTKNIVPFKILFKFIKEITKLSLFDIITHFLHFLFRNFIGQ